MFSVGLQLQSFGLATAEGIRAGYYPRGGLRLAADAKCPLQVLVTPFRSAMFAFGANGVFPIRLSVAASPIWGLRPSL
jgi:hypothetical protein